MVAKMGADALDKIMYYTLPWNPNNDPWIHVEMFFASNESFGSIERSVQNYILGQLYMQKIKAKFALLEIQGYTFSVDAKDNGIVIKVSGYRSTIFLVLEIMIMQVRQFGADSSSVIDSYSF